MLVIFKFLVEFLFTYAAPIWFPNTSQTSRKKSQVVENTSLDIATSYIRMTGIDNLHAELKPSRLKITSEFSAPNFLHRVFQNDQASIPIVTADRALRDMKHTLQKNFRKPVEIGTYQEFQQASENLCGLVGRRLHPGHPDGQENDPHMSCGRLNPSKETEPSPRCGRARHKREGTGGHIDERLDYPGAASHWFLLNS